MGESRRNSCRPHQHRVVPESADPERKSDEGIGRRTRSARSRDSQPRRKATSRPLRCIHRYEADRDARPQADKVRSGAHRRDQNDGRRRDIDGRSRLSRRQHHQILSENRMKELVDELEARDRATLSPEEKQLRDLYDAFTDTKQIETRGLKPIKSDLARIAAIKTTEDVAILMGDPAFPGGSIIRS